MMRIAVYTLLCAGLSACATDVPRNASGHPRLDRVGQETAVIAQRAPLSLPDLVRMERAGAAPAEIVARLRSTGQKIAFDTGAQARLRELGASEALLNALREAEAQAKETDRLTADVDRERARSREYVIYRDYYAYPYSYYPYSYSPYWGRFHPYVGYSLGHYRGWGSGIYWSW
jgi:hypothetical protein